MRHFLDRYLGFLRQLQQEIARGNNYLWEIIRVKIITPMTTAQISLLYHQPGMAFLTVVFLEGYRNNNFS